MPWTVSHKMRYADMKLPDNMRLTVSPEKVLIQVLGVGCDLAAIRTVVCDATREAGFPEDQVAQIELAVDEACTNIIIHAYGRDQQGQPHAQSPEMQIAIRPEADRLVIDISDRGRRLDSAKIRPKDLQALMQEGRVDGYGIPIMHRCMDEVSYHSDADGTNTLRLVKYIKSLRRDGTPPVVDQPPKR